MLCTAESFFRFFSIMFGEHINTSHPSNRLLGGLSRIVLPLLCCVFVQADGCPRPELFNAQPIVGQRRKWQQQIKWTFRLTFPYKIQNTAKIIKQIGSNNKNIVHHLLYIIEMLRCMSEKIVGFGVMARRESQMSCFKLRIKVDDANMKIYKRKQKSAAVAAIATMAAAAAAAATASSSDYCTTKDAQSSSNFCCARFCRQHDSHHKSVEWLWIVCHCDAESLLVARWWLFLAEHEATNQVIFLIIICH